MFLVLVVMWLHRKAVYTSLHSARSCSSAVFSEDPFYPWQYMHHTWHDSISMIFRADGRLAAGWLGAQMAAQAQQRGREAGYGVCARRSCRSAHCGSLSHSGVRGWRCSSHHSPPGRHRCRWVRVSTSISRLPANHRQSTMLAWQYLETTCHDVPFMIVFEFLQWPSHQVRGYVGCSM